MKPASESFLELEAVVNAAVPLPGSVLLVTTMIKRTKKTMHVPNEAVFILESLARLMISAQVLASFLPLTSDGLAAGEVGSCETWRVQQQQSSTAPLPTRNVEEVFAIARIAKSLRNLLFNERTGE